MEYEDNNAKAIFVSMMKSNKKNKEQLNNKKNRSFSYWLKWCLGFKKM